MPTGSVLGRRVLAVSRAVPLNDAGDIAVGVSATQTGSGLWVGNHESLDVARRARDAAQGAENNAGFSFASGRAGDLNRNGDVAFSADLNAAPYATINSANYHDGTWILNRSGAVASTFAGSGLPEIGPDAQVFGFHTFTYPGLNRNAEAFTRGYYRVSPAASSVVPFLGEVSASGLDVRGYNGQPLPQLGPNAKLTFSNPGGISSTCDRGAGELFERRRESGIGHGDRCRGCQWSDGGRLFRGPGAGRRRSRVHRLFLRAND